MARAAAAALVTAVLCVAPSAAPADSDLPSGKFGVVGGLRQGVGSIQDHFGLGVLGGIQAGWQPTSVSSPWSLGVEWSWLTGRLGADDPATIDGALNLVEMSLGFRVRRVFGQGAPQFLFFGAGGTLLRTNIPIPPETGRTYAGGYAGAGFEFYVGARYLVSLEARYSVISGPGSLSALASFAFGN